MGLFTKKKNDYETASNELNNQEALPAVQRLVMEQVIDNDERSTELVDLLKDGHPLILNFEKLNTMGANKLIAFFAGAAYALDGNVITINKYTYLFARKVDFLDGSLNEFVQQL